MKNKILICGKGSRVLHLEESRNPLPKTSRPASNRPDVVQRPIQKVSKNIDKRGGNNGKKN